MMTPLPSASPSALITTGNFICSQYPSASLLLENVRASAVGILHARINSFAKIFEDSIRAADLVGPNARNFSAANRSMIPPASGSSGPTTVRSTRFSFAKTTSACKSLARIGTFSAISQVPPLPGAQKIRSACGDCRSFHARACSRPPLPITRILMEDSTSGHCRGSPVSCKAFGVAGERPATTIIEPSSRWRFAWQNRDVQFFRVPNDREARAHVNLFADQYFVQMMHAADRLAIEGHDQVALTHSGAFGRAIFLN